MRTQVAVVVLALAAAARAGDEPKRIDLGAPDRWTAGEVVTASVMESTHTTMSGGSKGAEAGLNGEVETRLEAKFVQKCLEADAQGRPVRSLVRIDAWSMKGATRDDRCLEGAILEVSAAGWTLSAVKTNPSPAAVSWLETRFGEDGRGFCGGFAEIAGGVPRAAGETWEAQPSAIANGLVKGGIPFAVKTGNWKYRLAETGTSPSGATAKVVFDETIAISGESRQGGRSIEIAEGSSVRARGSYSGTPGAWRRDGHMQTVSETSLDTSMGGLAMQVAITAEETEDWTAGGTPPDLPKLPAGAEANSIVLKERWAVGDSLLERGELTRTTLATPVGEDEKAAAERTESKESWECELECHEVDDEGHPRVVTVVMRRWSATDGGTTDECLTGAVIRVTRDGWKITAGGEAATARAKEWLSERYGRPGHGWHALRYAMTPMMRVSPGETWASDPDVTTAALNQRMTYPIEQGSVRGKGTFSGMRKDGRGPTAAIEYEVEASIACVPNCNGAGADVLKGTVQVKGTTDGPLTKWERRGAFRDTTRVDVTVPGEPNRRLDITDVCSVARSPLTAEGRSALSWATSASAKVDRRDYAGAIEDGTRAIAADPKVKGGWFERARAKVGAGDEEGAIADYSKAVEIDPELAAAWNNLGVLRRGRGDLDGAISDYTKAIEASPKYANAWRNRGRAKAAKQDFAAAIADYDKAIECRPKYADAYSDRGMARYNLREYARAAEDHAKAAELEPKQPRHLMNRGNAKSAQGDLAGALADHDAAIAVDPRYALAYYFRADVKDRTKDTKGALADYDKAIELDPKFASNWNDRGCLRQNTGDHDGAIADFTRAAEIDPKDPNPWFNRAKSLAEKGDLDGAVADCTKSLELKPGYATAYKRRGDYRRDAGDEDAALADWAKALEFDAKYGSAHMSIARSRFAPGLPEAPVVEGIRAAIAVDEDPDYEHLWLWLARTRAGEVDAASKELADYAAAWKPSGDDDDWYPVVVALLTGKTTEDAAIAAAKTTDAKRSAERLCEAAFYAGMLRALRGETAKAIELFDRCVATDVRHYTEFDEAKRWRAALLLGGSTRAAKGTAGRAIVSPDPRGPLARAGLRDGDRITAVDGTLLSPSGLGELLRTARPGTRVRLDVVRDGSTLQATVTLGDWAAK